MKKFIPVLALLTAVGLLAVSSSALAKKDVFDLDETYPLAPDGLIRLTTNDADVKITGSDRTDVHLVVHYESSTKGLFLKVSEERFDMEVVPANGNLTIREFSPSSTTVGLLIHSSREDYEITLEVPQGASLKIRGDDDDYTIRNVQGEISMRFEDGEALIEDCNGGHFDLEVEDGSIEMVGGTGFLEAFTEDGQIYIESGAFKELRVETEDGRIEVATQLAENGNYVLESEDGRIVFTVLGGGGEFEVNFEDGRVRADRAFKVEDEDDEMSLFSLPGGNARVRIRTEDGSVRLSK